MRKSLAISLTVVFASLHAVLYLMSFGLWRNWGIYLETIEGVLLGPQIGFSAAFIGSVTARIVRPDVLWMFGIVAEPVSVLIAAFLWRGKWKPALAIYAILLVPFFVDPIGRALPIWTLLDILFALLLVYPAAKFRAKLFAPDLRRLPLTMILISFVTIAADSLVRVFLLVPGQMHTVFFGSFENLNAAFVGAAVDSYIEDGLVVLISVLVGVPLVMNISKLGIWKELQGTKETTTER